MPQHDDGTHADPKHSLAAATTLLRNAVEILERKSPEIRRQDPIRSVADILRQTEAMLLSAERALRARDAFIATMSHELRTPLNAIIGFSEAMRMDLFGETGNTGHRNYLEYIHSSAMHLLSLINDFLDLSKIEAGKLDLTCEPVEIKEVIARALTMVQETLIATGLTVQIDIPGDLPSVAGDNRRLLQVFLNLLSNAVKFTPEGGLIRISGRHEHAIEITVADTGIGMTSEQVSVAMEPFRQIDNALSRKHAGTGLGLPLSRHLVELHGGMLDVKSAPDKGTAVTVSLPAAR